MTIMELREKRNKAWAHYASQNAAAKAFVETKRDKDGLLSAEDATSYAEMEQKIKDYGAEIERMEQMAAMDAQLSKPTSTPLTGKPMNGDGKGKPLGIFAETGGGTIGVTAASATAVTADEIINLVYSLKRPYRKNAKFIMNDQTIAALRKLKDTDTMSVLLPQKAARMPPTKGNT